MEITGSVAGDDVAGVVILSEPVGDLYDGHFFDEHKEHGENNGLIGGTTYTTRS